MSASIKKTYLPFIALISLGALSRRECFVATRFKIQTLQLKVNARFVLIWHKLSKLFRLLIQRLLLKSHRQTASFKKLAHCCKHSTGSSDVVVS